LPASSSLLEAQTAARKVFTRKRGITGLARKSLPLEYSASQRGDWSHRGCPPRKDGGLLKPLSALLPVGALVHTSLGARPK
jgi:hypothetical protein